MSGAMLYSHNLHAKDSGFLGLSLGYYNISDHDKNSVDLRAEYRPDISVVFKKLKPWLGIQVTTNASLWAGGGLLLEFEPTKNIFITPSLGVGFYAHGDDDIDLSHPIQFRSQIEIAYRLENQSRVALAFSHMSHAGLGGYKNPGAESLLLYYHTPIHTMF